MPVSVARCLRLGLALLCAAPATRQLVAADLRNTVRNLRARAETAAPRAEEKTPLVVPLQRAKVLEGAGIRGAGLYLGLVSVGSPPQELRVLLDTAAGEVLLPHGACDSDACAARSRYWPRNSQSVQEMSEGGTTVSFSSSDLGDGDLTAIFVKDRVCLASGVGQTAGAGCVPNVPVLAATQMDRAPFLGMPGDGILGLGLPALAVGQARSWAVEMAAKDARFSKFGLSLGRDAGELMIGGFDMSRGRGPISWRPVAKPDMGYWQVEVTQVLVGGIVVDDCARGCTGVVDTGAYRLGVPAPRLAALSQALSVLRASQGVRAACEGPGLEFDIGGEFRLAMSPEDYANATCAMDVGVLPFADDGEMSGLYIFGVSILQRYYTAFDLANFQLGFAPVQPEDDASLSASPRADDAISSASLGAESLLV